MNDVSPAMGEPASLKLPLAEVSNVSEKPAGISFDMIISPAQSPVPQSPRVKTPVVESVDYIKRRLERAEERRKSLEEEMLVGLAKRNERAEAARSVKDAKVKIFQEKTQQAMEQRLEANKENYETRMVTLKERLRSHDVHAKKVRELAGKLHAEKEEKIKASVSRMSDAQERRNKRLDEIIDKLKEHERHLEEVREMSRKDAGGDDVRKKMMEKMETALTNRENQLKAIQERLHDHDKHVSEVIRRVKGDTPSQNGGGGEGEGEAADADTDGATGRRNQCGLM